MMMIIMTMIIMIMIDNNQHHHYDYRTITGVICAADYYQFSDLRDGALQFFPMCLKVGVVMMILRQPD